jgi:hypothetical protein
MSSLLNTFSLGNTANTTSFSSTPSQCSYTTPCYPSRQLSFLSESFFLWLVSLYPDSEDDEKHSDGWTSSGQELDQPGPSTNTQQQRRSRSPVSRLYNAFAAYSPEPDPKRTKVFVHRNYFAYPCHLTQLSSCFTGRSTPCPCHHPRPPTALQAQFPTSVRIAYPKQLSLSLHWRPFPTLYRFPT